MKKNKTISIEISLLGEMLEYCEKQGFNFSLLIVEMWSTFKRDRGIESKKVVKKEKIKKVCEFCDREFQTSWHITKYCSNYCSNRAKKDRQIEKLWENIDN